jgi:hypothetical protein
MHGTGKVHRRRRCAPVDGNTQFGRRRTLLPVWMKSGLEGGGECGRDTGHQQRQWWPAGRGVRSGACEAIPAKGGEGVRIALGLELSTLVAHRSRIRESGSAGIQDAGDVSHHARNT